VHITASTDYGSHKLVIINQLIIKLFITESILDTFINQLVWEIDVQLSHIGNKTPSFPHHKYRVNCGTGGYFGFTD